MGRELHHLASKFYLNNDFKKRFEKFLLSDLFNNQPIIAKSRPWEFHSKEIKYSIKNNLLTVQGTSGYNIPDRKNSINFYLRYLKDLVKKIIRRNTNHNLSYKDAFEKVMSEERNTGYQRLIFDQNRIIAKNFSDCKKKFPFDYAVYGHIIKSFYYINILNSYINLSEKKFIAEIGAGNGNLMSLLKALFNSKCIINIDLPETLIMCIPYLENLFPKAKFLLPNEIEQKIDINILMNYDFIFLTPGQTDLLEGDIVDVFINTASFGEMNLQQISEYINLIQKVSKSNSYFFCSDAVEKIAVDANKENKDFQHSKPIRFFEYPFKKNEVLFFEICKFTGLVQDNPSYLRLEKILK